METVSAQDHTQITPDLRIANEKMITGIFFSEFHPTAGPKISYQVPEDFISKELFDSIHHLIIPKLELHKKLITVTVHERKIVGCPIGLEDPRYPRNVLMFNLCLVLNQDARVVRYGAVVKKLANYLTQLELESSFISDEKQKETLPQLLQEIKNGLNQEGHCSVTLGRTDTLHLKVGPNILEPRVIQDQDVPVLLTSPESVLDMPWDLTTQQILHYVDGFLHVAKIAAEADVEINLVKACIQNLLHYNVVKIISIFQYSNVYTVTSELNQLTRSPELKEECLEYVARTGSGHTLPLFRDVLKLYCHLTPGITVRDLCSRFNPHGLKIDERKLIQFGLLKGFIRRVHEYPVKLPGDSGICMQSPVYKYCDGCYSMDEICCKTGMSYRELKDKLESDPNVVICCK